ncbi:MAG: hypothetical protein ACTSQI_19025 [Candidatus Helarchaeota archaeon]
MEISDELNRYRKNDILNIKKCGYLAKLCGVFQLVMIGFYLGMVLEVPIYLIYNLTFSILGIGVGVLQLFVIFIGVKILIGQDLAGKTLMGLSAIFLILFTICIPISLIFFWDAITWGPYGIIVLNNTLLEFNSIHLIWYLLVMICLTAFIMSFGTLLLNLGKKYKRQGLNISGISFLIQVILVIIQFCLLFNSFLRNYLFGCISLIIGFLYVIGFFLLGTNLQKISL